MLWVDEAVLETEEAMLETELLELETELEVLETEFELAALDFYVLEAYAVVELLYPELYTVILEAAFSILV